MLKREIAEMRRAVLPLRDPMRRFAPGAVPGHPRRTTAPYFRDVADHLVRVSESIDTLDLLLSTAFDAHLAAASRSSRTRTCARSRPASAWSPYPP